jgi:hypothetical protein
MGRKAAVDADILRYRKNKYMRDRRAKLKRDNPEEYARRLAIQRERHREWSRKNKDKLRQYYLNWHARGGKGHKKAYAQRKFEENPELVRERRRIQARNLMAKIKADPVRFARWREKQKAYNRKKYERTKADPILKAKKKEIWRKWWNKTGRAVHLQRKKEQRAQRATLQE